MRRLFVDIHNILGLDISVKDAVSNSAVGQYKSIFKGKGVEFEGYRQYVEGVDDASNIDWTASSRSDNILVKQFIEERNLQVFFIMDVSSTMEQGSTKKLKAEYSAEVALSLAHTMLQTGDQVGYILHSNTEVDSSPARGGPGQFYAFSDKLTNPAVYGGKFNLEAAANHLFNMGTKGAIVIIISDFIDLYPGWEHTISLLGQKFDVIGVSIKDPIDMEMPAGVKLVDVEDPSTGQQVTIHAQRIKKKYDAFNKQREAQLAKAFSKGGMGFISLTTDKSFVKPITDYFHRRAQQWR